MRFIAVWLVFHALTTFAAERGLSENVAANNAALLVSVSKGLPGLDIDIAHLKTILAHQSNQFLPPTVLRENDGTTTKISEQLTKLADSVDSRGTLFFYFTGHGAKGLIQVQDRTMKIGEIRKAIEDGRKTWGPLSRLVMMFDSCHSGSLLDPVRGSLPVFSFERPELASSQFLDEVYEEMTKPNREGELPSNYWKNLFVFASARADETCDASGSGSAFTIGLKKGFDKAIATNGTLGELVAVTKAETKGSHPMARFDPASLENEKMIP